MGSPYIETINDTRIVLIYNLYIAGSANMGQLRAVR